MASAIRVFFAGRQSANPADAANEDGPQPDDVIVTGVPVDVEVAAATESDAASSAGAALAAQGLEVVAQQAKDQRLEIAQSLVRNMRQIRPNVCLMNHDQILRHTCDCHSPGVDAEHLQHASGLYLGLRRLQRPAELLLSRRHQEPDVCG